MDNAKDVQDEIFHRLDEIRKLKDELSNALRLCSGIMANLSRIEDRVKTEVVEIIQAEGPKPRVRKSTNLGDNDTPVVPANPDAPPVPIDITTLGKRCCSNCGKPGHRATTCQNPAKVKPLLEPGKRGCGNCGKPGHRRTTCPELYQ